MTSIRSGELRKVRNADISTIHSFCSRLIRSRSNELGLDPAFRIGEKGELALMRDEAMEELLEESYESMTDSFQNLAEAYAPGRDDSSLVFACFILVMEFKTCVSCVINCS